MESIGHDSRCTSGFSSHTDTRIEELGGERPTRHAVPRSTEQDSRANAWAPQVMSRLVRQHGRAVSQVACAPGGDRPAHVPLIENDALQAENRREVERNVE